MQRDVVTEHHNKKLTTKIIWNVGSIIGSDLESKRQHDRLGVWETTNDWVCYKVLCYRNLEMQNKGKINNYKPKEWQKQQCFPTRI